MIIDLHCHSKYSRDNHLEPEDLIHRAIELGLDGICLTEHHSLGSSWPVTRLNIPKGFLVLRGIEVSTDCGHLLVYGVPDDSWNRWGRNNYLKLSKVVDSVHDLGGICVPAHPFRGWESLGEKVFSCQGIDAIETHNGTNADHQNQPALIAAKDMGLPSIGGSDCHYLDRVGKAYTEFVNPVGDMQDLIREIKAGNCRGVLANGSAGGE
jgi:predicted metal-dependent phosphoesterase TrpH